jgi:hypothetical protein
VLILDRTGIGGLLVGASGGAECVESSKPHGMSSGVSSGKRLERLGVTFSESISRASCAFDGLLDGSLDESLDGL